MATKSYIGIKNEAKSNTLELHFTDYIYDGFDWNTWEEKKLVQDTIDAIKAANPDTIKVVINSLGGDVMVGLALYNYLKAHKAEKEVEIIGFAASIASVMAMCASPGKLKMAKNAFMIIHAAWSYAMGNAKEMREHAENLDKVSNNLADIYADRSGKKREDFTAMWADGDYWMDGAEAKELGLVDELMNTEPVQAKVNVTEFGFKNIPEKFIQASDEPAEHKSFFKKLENKLMALIDTFTNSAKTVKEDKKFENVADKDTIIEFLQNMLTPVFAEIEAIKPKAEETKPVEETKEEVKPEAEKKEEPKTEVKTDEKKPEASAEEIRIAALEQQIKDLKAATAKNISEPETETPVKASIGRKIFQPVED